MEKGTSFCHMKIADAVTSIDCNDDIERCDKFLTKFALRSASYIYFFV